MGHLLPRFSLPWWDRSNAGWWGSSAQPFSPPSLPAGLLTGFQGVKDGARTKEAHIQGGMEGAVPRHLPYSLPSVKIRCGSGHLTALPITLSVQQWGREAGFWYYWSRNKSPHGTASGSESPAQAPACLQPLSFSWCLVLPAPKLNSVPCSLCFPLWAVTQTWFEMDTLWHSRLKVLMAKRI